MIRKFLLIPAMLVLCVAWALPASADPIRTAEKNLEKSLQTEDQELLEKTVIHLIGFDNKDAAKAMVDGCKFLLKMSRTNGQDYWTVVRGTASFTKEPALKEVFRFLDKMKREPIARDILYLMKNGDAHNLTPFLLDFIGSPPDDIAVMAIELLGSHGSKEAIEPLIKLLKKTRAEGAVGQAVVKTLTNLTGENYGPNVSNWEGWLERTGGEVIPRNNGGSNDGNTVVSTFDKTDEYEFEDLTTIPEDLIVVLVSDHTDMDTDKFDHNFDHIEKTLKRLGIPHTTVLKTEFDGSSYKLDGKMALLVNCNQFRDHCLCPDCKVGGDKNLRLFQCTDCDVHDPQNNMLSDGAVKKIKEFVEKGGYLFTEDWELEEILERAWPKHVGVGSYMEEDKVVVLPYSGKTMHPYMSKIFGKIKDDLAGDGGGTAVEGFKELGHTWSVDDESPSINVRDKKKVDVLMTSPELGKKYKGDDTVALTFTVGKNSRPVVVSGGDAYDPLGMDGGRVVHVMSHFGKQSSEHEEYTLLNLLINFLTEANERRQAGKGPAAK